MDDEAKRQEYLRLRNGMYDIKQRLNKTIEEHENLLSTVKKGIFVNGKSLHEDQIRDKISDIKFVKTSVDETIASINYKL